MTDSPISRSESEALRREIIAIRGEHAQFQPDLDRLKRALWGENGGEVYRGFFKEFATFRSETGQEFQKVRLEVLALQEQVGSIAETCDTMEERQRTKDAKEAGRKEGQIRLIQTAKWVIGTLTSGGVLLIAGWVWRVLTNQ